MPVLIRVAACALLLVLSFSHACAGVISVTHDRSGFFGFPLSGGGLPLVGDTDVLTAGTTYQISATGEVLIGGGAFVSPNGLDIPRSAIIGPFGQGFTPLEEGILDSGGTVPTTDGSSIAPAVGALIAAFVPTSTESLPGFDPFDSDFGGSIDATELFLVGTSRTYHASASTEDSTLGSTRGLCRTTRALLRSPRPL